MARKVLGRGFSSLIPTEMIIDDQFDPTLGVDSEISKLQEISLDRITPDPDQPRRHFDEELLQKLADSIKIHGVLQPIVLIKKDDSDRFVIVAGERRFRASKLAGLKKIPAIVRELSDQDRLELSLIENIQRSDLNVLETATAYLKLQEQFNMTAKQIGERVGGRSESAVLNTLRLLNLPDEVKKHVYSGELKEGQVRPLLKVDKETVLKILPKIIEEGWSARKLEQFLVQYKKQLQEQKEKSAKSLKSLTKMPFEQNARRIATRLKTDVNIKTSARGNGRITIKFKNEEDLKRIEKILSE